MLVNMNASDAAVAGLMAYVDDMKTKIEEMQLKIEESFTKLNVLFNLSRGNQSYV